MTALSIPLRTSRAPFLRRERSGQLGVDLRGSAIFIYGPERRHPALAIFQLITSLVRAERSVTCPNSVAWIWVGFNQIRPRTKSAPCNPAAKQAHGYRANRLKAFQVVVSPFVAAIGHAEKHDRRKLPCPTSVVQDLSK